MFKIKFLLFIGVISVIYSSNANAECRGVSVGNFAIASNPVLNSVLKTDGAECRIAFTSSRLAYDNSSIVLKPSNGKLDIQQVSQFLYTPKKGYKGKDKITVKLCGTNSLGEKGCATITYDIDIE